MSENLAKNIGALLNQAPSSFNQSNFFGGGQPQPLPKNISSPKGFIGREDELKELRKHYAEDKRVFVLHGLGGAGKSELARKFIEENKNDYEAFIEIEMNGLSDNALSPKDAMLTVIRAFTSNVDANLDEVQIKSLYISLLNQHRTVLFFDNAKDRAQIETLNVSSNVLLITTSRDNFTLTGGTSKLIDTMPPDDAKKLLFSIAGEERLDGHADELAYLAGYLPMSLLPLASILVEDITESAENLVEKYSKRKERLKLQDPNRQNISVEASFDLSYEKLNDELKKRWLALTVFPYDFGEEALETVWKGKASLFASSSKAKNVKESLSALVKSNLVIFESRRFRLHDIARDYTREKINQDELAVAEKLHATYYGEFLQKHNEVTIENLMKFDVERTNIEYGFKWTKENIEFDKKNSSICINYTNSTVRPILSLRLDQKEIVEWMKIGLSVSLKINNSVAIGAALDCLGSAYSGIGEFRKSIEYFEQSLLIAKQINHRQGESTSLDSMGVAYMFLGEYQKAIEYFEQALEISREIKNRKGENVDLAHLGSAYNNLGEHKKAIEYFEKALEISREIKDLRGVSANLGNLGSAYRRLGEYHRAIEFNEQSLEIAQELKDRKVESENLATLGKIYSGLGEKQKAVEYFEQALEISREINDPISEGSFMFLLGVTYLHLGEQDKSSTFLDKGLRILELFESPHAEITRQFLKSIKNKDIQPPD